MKNPCNGSNFIKISTNKDIIDIISDLSCNKAPGPINIPIKIMKLTKDCLANNVSVFLLFFSSGTFPDRLKTAKILAMFSKGSKLECPDYRPISLLSNLDKIIEKLIHNTSMEFLNEQKIVYCKEYGFRNDFSIYHAIINLIDNVESAIDNKQFVCGVFLT